MYIEKQKDYTYVFPFIDNADGKAYQPCIEIVTDRGLDNSNGVRYLMHKIFYTESDAAKLAAGLKEAFKIAKKVKTKP